VANVNIEKLVKFHQEKKGLLTVTSVQPQGKFGALNIEDNKVSSFLEKPRGDGHWINGGFFVCQPEVFGYIKEDATIFEKEPLENIAKSNQMFAYKHEGFWKPMDTLRDKIELEESWQNNPPWKIW
jgi:glucose-1-phosphate cytidylyltransferase